MRQSNLETVKLPPKVRWFLAGQAVYFLGTGVWPFVHQRSFEAVTGPKTDFWLVKTVGLLVSVAGAVLLMASLRSRITPEVALMGMGSSAALAAVDMAYVAKGRNSRVYLADAAAELSLLAGWAAAARFIRE